MMNYTNKVLSALVMLGTGLFASLGFDQTTPATNVPAGERRPGGGGRGGPGNLDVIWVGR